MKKRRNEIDLYLNRKDAKHEDTKQCKKYACERTIIFLKWNKVSGGFERSITHAFASLSVIVTPQMCLHCRRNREEKTQLLLSSQCLESIYGNTQGSSQHSSALLRVVCRHTCLCAWCIVTSAGTTHTNPLRGVRLSKYTSGGLSFDKSNFTTFFCTVNAEWTD